MRPPGGAKFIAYERLEKVEGASGLPPDDARGTGLSSPSGGMTIGFIGWLLAGLVVTARSMRDMTDVSAAWVARAV